MAYTYADANGSVMTALNFMGLDANRTTFGPVKTALGLAHTLIGACLYFGSMYENAKRGLMLEALTLFAVGVIMNIFGLIQMIVCRKSTNLHTIIGEMESMINDCLLESTTARRITVSCLDSTNRVITVWKLGLLVIPFTFPTIWIVVLMINYAGGGYKSTYLPVDVILPGDLQVVSPYNELLNVTMCLSFAVLAYGYFGFNGFVFTQMIFIRYQLDVLGAKMVDLFDDLNLSNYVRQVTAKLSYVVERHDRIIQFTKLVENTCSIYIAMLQIFLGIIMCTCALIIKGIMQDGTGIWQAFLVLPACVGLIFILCKLGTEIHDANANIGTAIYNSNWESYPCTAIRRTLMIIMMRTQIPIRITGFGIVVLNLRTFTAIMNTAYTYYAFFRST